MPSGYNIKNDTVEVVVHEGQFEFERALKRFSVLWKNSGVIRELSFRRDHPSRSARRKEKVRRAVSRRMRGPH